MLAPHDAQADGMKLLDCFADPAPAMRSLVADFGWTVRDIAETFRLADEQVRRLLPDTNDLHGRHNRAEPRFVAREDAQ